VAVKLVLLPDFFVATFPKSFLREAVHRVPRWKFDDVPPGLVPGPVEVRDLPASPVDGELEGALCLPRVPDSYSSAENPESDENALVLVGAEQVDVNDSSVGNWQVHVPLHLSSPGIGLCFFYLHRNLSTRSGPNSQFAKEF